MFSRTTLLLLLSLCKMVGTVTSFRISLRYDSDLWSIANKKTHKPLHASSAMLCGENKIFHPFNVICKALKRSLCFSQRSIINHKPCHPNCALRFLQLGILHAVPTPWRTQQVNGTRPPKKLRLEAGNPRRYWSTQDTASSRGEVLKCKYLM